MQYQNTLSFAQQMDDQDPLKAYRKQFHFPQHEGQPYIYFCGNSLGLQPKATLDHVVEELDAWQSLGVEGHFKSKNPWYSYHHFLEKSILNIVGAASTDEVVVMNALTVNLHLLMLSFYRPTKKRYKILIESDAFPSDKYAVDSQAQLHGFDPKDAIVELAPRSGEYVLRTTDILAKIEELGDSLALVMLGAVNYYTGQFFELDKITKAAHQVGAIAGFDCAHAAGNIPLQLHDWQVDFACWCSYKYLNSGPGGVGGVFIHQKHVENIDLFRLAGWWGNDEKTRFQMPRQFVPQARAAAWQMSNAPILPMAAHKAALAIFDQVSMDQLRAKSELLTGYLEFVLNDINQKQGSNLFNIITPKDTKQRGCQLSILTKETGGKELFNYLTQNGVIADWREPNVIRVAPVPLYNRFEEVFRFGQLIEAAITETSF